MTHLRKGEQMDAHPDFADRTIPREASLGAFRLTPLSPAEVQEDFVVVRESTAVLTGLFGDAWPDGLTFEENLADLTRHDREFRARQAFSWIARAADGTYLGCAYLYPDASGGGTGRIFTWIRRRPDRLALLAEFNAAFRAWLMPQLPEDYAANWTSNDMMDPDDG